MIIWADTCKVTTASPEVDWTTAIHSQGEAASFITSAIGNRLEWGAI